MAIWSLAKKELRLLVRDRLGAVVLLVMPILFILLLGLLLGEGFGQKPDNTLRVSIVDLDEGRGLDDKPWAWWVMQDLRDTPGIRIEVIPSRAEAEQLVRDHKRAAVLVLEPDFSDRINRCSFLADGDNPFHREGVYLQRVGATLLRDETQSSGAAIMEQVVQVTMLRVILPYMIGRAFEKLSDEKFIELLGQSVNLPVPENFRKALDLVPAILKTQYGLPAKLPDTMSLKESLAMAAGKDAKMAAAYRAKVGEGVKKALEEQFKKYNLTGMTWAALTKSRAERDGATVEEYVNRDGSGLLNRGAHRYQILVPAYTVMFAFFLVLSVGWLFVAERSQGTLKRLRLAPVSRAEVIVGKLLPCYIVSVAQGVFLLIAGRVLFGMRWGPEHWPLWEQATWLLAVVMCTSLAAMGLALLVAALARTEMQVALFGAVPVLILSLIGGCVLPREMMPEQTQALSLLTPQGWALDAYRELLNLNPLYEPNLGIVVRACLVLVAFGSSFLALAWAILRLD